MSLIRKIGNRSKQIPGGLAQMVERTLCMREARGSMPLSSKTLFFAFLYALVKFYASWSVRCANFYVNWVSRTGEMFQRERFWIIFFFFPCFLEEYHGSWCFLACSFTSLTKKIIIHVMAEHNNLMKKKYLQPSPSTFHLYYFF